MWCGLIDGSFLCREPVAVRNKAHRHTATASPTWHRMLLLSSVYSVFAKQPKRDFFPSYYDCHKYTED